MKSRRIYLFTFLLIACAALFQSCGKDEGNSPGGDNVTVNGSGG